MESNPYKEKNTFAEMERKKLQFKMFNTLVSISFIESIIKIISDDIHICRKTS